MASYVIAKNQDMDSPGFSVGEATLQLLLVWLQAIHDYKQLSC